ncbi:DUF302 domain-containing protein [Actinospica durhamensis]|uniref:DUF302 domain-containing protein n=1 Tax=Actinospica durhamensis TaxID=1508375 RepID=A0A941IU46_9ACTN|nr:DUF302 domain-containing protein [Actinospica durhamensis]MBR7835106.1 DUF302 domain-containing protein [Actinospica durhamensis]
MSELTSIPSAHGFAETVTRVEQQIAARGATVFARFDHAANAREAGLHMPPTTVLVFGAARGGTPVMNASPDLAYELPLRLLVRQHEDQVELLYRSIDAWAAQYGVPAQVIAPLRLVEKVAAAAAAAD